MDGNPIVAVFLPVALGIVMFGLGLTLTLDDFKRVVTFPKPVIVGLVCQMLVLPVVCFAIASAFGLAPELAVGLMLLAASPGGATANLRRGSETTPAMTGAWRTTSRDPSEVRCRCVPACSVLYRGVAERGCDHGVTTVRGGWMKLY